MTLWRVAQTTSPSMSARNIPALIIRCTVTVNARRVGMYFPATMARCGWCDRSLAFPISQHASLYHAYTQRVNNLALYTGKCNILLLSRSFSVSALMHPAHADITPSRPSPLFLRYMHGMSTHIIAMRVGWLTPLGLKTHGAAMTQLPHMSTSQI